MRAPDRAELITALEKSNLKSFVPEIVDLLDEKYSNPKHGHFNEWKSIYESLSPQTVSLTNFNQDAIIIGARSDLSEKKVEQLKRKLLVLSPWRKGPFKLFGINIDTEWRSDLKWSRITPHIELKDKQILDIGCGNGYYALRMQGCGAKLVVGIDPSWHYVFQFHALQKYASLTQSAFVLPFAFEEIPQMNKAFDCIFSMGVLYHRKKPKQHLEKIYSMLTDEGQLILETLIINDEKNDLLIPKERYANMPNVWMIPRIDLLQKWLFDAGYKHVNVIDVTSTTIEEQRQTEWMTRYSLAQALDANNPELTIEGYQAPLRATLIAEK